MREQVLIIFKKHGWSARVPPCDEKSGKVHITVRDGGYRSAGDFDKGKPVSVSVIVDKLGVTPAIGGHCRHDCRRQKCGATLKINLGTTEEVRGSPGPRSSLPTDDGYGNDFPRLEPLQSGKRFTKKSGRKPALDTPVVERVDH